MLKLSVAVLTIALAAVSALGQSAPTLTVQETNGPGLPADLFYGNTKVKPLRLRPGTNQVITIDDADFFVSQHYIDFLNRFSDQGGQDYWTARITQCGTDATCIANRRIDVSAAFFIELEFQATGYYVYKFYLGSLNRKPSFAEFMPDRRQVVAGTDLEAGKQSFALSWVQRAEFLQKYPASLDGPSFVDALLATVLANSGVNLSSQRSTLINLYNSNGGGNNGRAAVLRSVVEDATFSQSQYNPAFVRMQYFGYLRRDPDAGGESFWVNVLNNREPNNFRGMVNAFITSQEYRDRF